MKIVRSKSYLPFGAEVLVRGMDAEPAGPDLANATVVGRPSWALLPGQKGYKPGDSVRVEMHEGLGRRSLHAIAAGPIMDSNALYLPAGRLSMAEFRQRQAEMLSGDAA